MILIFNASFPFWVVLVASNTFISTTVADISSMSLTIYGPITKLSNGLWTILLFMFMT